MKFIDPHIHLFDLSLGDYSWLSPENPPFWQDKPLINKNFSVKDIELEGKNELEGFVHIEAGFDNEHPWREIHWLETHCKQHFKSVAHINLTLPAEVFNHQLQQLLAYKSVVGVRHILDDSAVAILNHENTVANLHCLCEHELNVELQMPLSNESAVTTLVAILEQLPRLSIIINHAGLSNDKGEINQEKNPKIVSQLNPFQKSNIEGSILEQSAHMNRWISGLTKLSQHKHCAIKCSGWEMFDRHYEIQWCETVISQCIAIFGIQRVMLGSNFPLCLFSKSYQAVWSMYTNLSYFNQKQLKQLCYTNAKNWYKF